MTLSAAVPALPVKSVTAAQTHYRDNLGFDIAWHNEPGRIGAVSHGDCAIFFREVDTAIEPVVLWIHAEDVDATYAALQSSGAKITDAIDDKPWGIRQFTVEDQSGHLIHFHNGG